MNNSKKSAALAAMLTMTMALPMTAGAQGDTRVITCGTLNLRSEATTQSDILGKYGWGTEVTVKSVSGDWSHVLVAGKSGYMYSKHLGKEGETNTAAYVCTNTRGLNLRREPDGDILGSYPRGTKVTVLSTSNQWSKVKVGNQTGYMLSRWLSDAKPSEGAQSIGSAVVANPKETQVLFLRSEPSTQSSALGYYRNGKRVTLLEKLDGWYKVSVDGQTGYMMARFLDVTDEVCASAVVYNPNGNSYVNFRKGASLNAGVISRIPVGTKIQVIDKGSDWSKVVIDGVTGYMSTWFLMF